jgi:hypothetical protein
MIDRLDAIGGSVRASRNQTTWAKPNTMTALKMMAAHSRAWGQRRHLDIGLAQRHRAITPAGGGQQQQGAGEGAADTSQAISGPNATMRRNEGNPNNWRSKQSNLMHELCCRQTVRWTQAHGDGVFPTGVKLPPRTSVLASAFSPSLALGKLLTKYIPVVVDSN